MKEWCDKDTVKSNASVLSGLGGPLPVISESLELISGVLTSLLLVVNNPVFVSVENIMQCLSNEIHLVVDWSLLTWIQHCQQEDKCSKAQNPYPQKDWAYVPCCH
jgi:hypothetical protein